MNLRHPFTGEFPEVLVVMQTELGSFDFAAFFATEENCFVQDDRIKGEEMLRSG